MNFLLHFGFATLTVTLVLLKLGVNCQDVLKCMSCKKAAHFTHCEEMVKCNPEREVCYVEEEIDIGGETVVNAGCREKDQCDAMGCFGDVDKRRKRSSIVKGDDTKTNIGDLNRDIVCHHCCNGDFCNMYGCPDSFDVSHLTGSRCFVCEHVLQPEHCNTIKNCEAGYSCGLERVTFGDGDRYNLLCIRTQKCDLLKLIHNNNGRKKRNYVSMWTDCCDTHLCNGYMPMKEDPPPLQSVTYNCPPRRYDATPNSSESLTTSTLTVGTLPSTVATTTITTTTTQITTATVCEDADSTCSTYNVGYICIGQYADWAKQHCAKYCGFCGTTTQIKANTSSNDSSPTSSTLEITTAFVCKDIESDCDKYDVDYICKGSYAEWAMQHCAKYCGFCGTTTQKYTNTSSNDSFPTSSTLEITTAFVCKDIESDCDKYDVDYICKGSYAEWARQHCTKYCGYCGTSTQKYTNTSSNDSSSTSSTLEVTTAFVCKDIDSDCDKYDVDYICKGSYAEWSRQHCAKYCGYCGTSTEVNTNTSSNDSSATYSTLEITTAFVCEDIEPDCDTYGVDYICKGSFAEWAKQHCTKYCGYCGTSSQLNSNTSSNDSSTVSTTPSVTIPSICEDKDANCDIYGEDYICKGSYAEWAKEHCTKYCGYCVTNRKRQFDKSRELEKSGQESLSIFSLITVFLMIVYVRTILSRKVMSFP